MTAAPDDWRSRALCLEYDPEQAFPLEGDNAYTATYARKFCNGCEVQPQCLEDALRTDSRFGIWGATSERQRAPMHKAYNRTRRAAAGEVGA